MQELTSKLSVKNGNNGTEINVKDFDAQTDGTTKSFVLQEIAEALKVFMPLGAEITAGSRQPDGSRSLLLMKNPSLSLEQELRRATDAFGTYKTAHGHALKERIDVINNTGVPDAVRAASVVEHRQ